MSLFSSVLTQEDIEYLNNLPEVLEAKARLSTTAVQYFKVALTESIRTALTERFGVNVSNVSHIPMRWIKGDTAPHVDRGASNFENTYLLYLNDSEGNFVIGDMRYPITENTGFIFSEGIQHMTQGTGSVPRLLLGPMNEFAQPVGGSGIIYYATYEDAIAQTNSIGSSSGDSIIITIGSYTQWKIAAAYGDIFPSDVFNTGFDLSTLSIYNASLYAYTPPVVQGNLCFLEGTEILCDKGSIPIEKLQYGDLVKTLNGYKAIVGIKRDTIFNPGNDDRSVIRLYSYDDKLFITGAHSVLVDSLTRVQKEKTAGHLGLVFSEDVDKLFVAESKCKLMAHIDDNAKPWASEGTYVIWHIALENTNENANYGIYANGYLVESCSIKSLK